MRLPKSVYVIENGGFTFGTDRVTPVTWDTVKRGRKVYTSFALTPEQAAILAPRMPLVASYNELRALIDTSHPSDGKL